MGVNESDGPKRVEPATVSDAISAALRTSSAANIVPGELPTGRAMLGAVGGVRGVIESVLPTLAFLVIYTITHDLVVSVVAPVALALVFVVARAGARAPMTAAIAGCVGIAFTAFLTVITGRAQNNFLPGIAINIVFLLALTVSLLVRRPLLAVFVGFIVGSPRAWLADVRKRRAMVVATWLWIGLFAARLAIELPLYLTANVSALAVARLITGVPLYAAVLWLSWLLVRTVYSGNDDGSVETAESNKVS